MVSDNHLESVRCASCGETYANSSLLERVSQAPCPQCGSFLLNSCDMVVESGVGSSECFGSLVPAKQERDWVQRWEILQREITQLCEPVKTELSSARVHEEANRILQFIVSASSLRDSLKYTSFGGITPENLKRAVQTDLRLALLIDTANLEKHTSLENPPRSGHKPSLGEIRSHDLPGTQSWQVHVEILHNGQSYDALQIAKDGIQGWHDALKGWGLI